MDWFKRTLFAMMPMVSVAMCEAMGLSDRLTIFCSVGLFAFGLLSMLQDIILRQEVQLSALRAIQARLGGPESS